jgi:hypothetical protein
MSHDDLVLCGGASCEPRSGTLAQGGIELS